MKKVVICEDDVKVVRDLRIACNTQKSKVIQEFQNGYELVEWYRLNYREADLVVLDLIMKKMDGFVAFHEILKIYPQASVVIISIENSLPLIKYLATAGAKDFIVKPYRLDDLKLKMQNIINTL